MSMRPLLRFAALACCVLPALAADQVWLRATLAEPASGEWRTQRPLVVRVDLGLRGETVPKAGLTLAPGQLVTLTLAGADGKTLRTDWTPSDGRTSTPLQVFPGQRRSFYFTLTEAGRHQLAPLPGRYTLRATLQSAAGSSWQGRMEAPPLTLTVLDAVLPEVAVTIPNAGEIVPGDPLLVAVAFAATPAFGSNDAYRAPDFTQRSWRESVALEMRNSAGQTIDLPWADPLVVPHAGEGQVRRGIRFGPIWLRVPAAATQSLPAGDYTLALSINRPAGREPISVSPVTIKVLPPSAANQTESRAASVVLALIEARALRQRLEATRSFGSWQDRLMTEAVAGLKQVAPLADVLARERPDDPRAALLRAEVLLAMANPSAASAELTRIEAVPAAKEKPWAAAIAGLRKRLAAPATDADRYFAPYWSKAFAAVRPADAKVSVVAPPSPAKRAPPSAGSPAVPVADAGSVQWATAARASSEYRATDYGAQQATGAPDVARYGDSGKAWAPKIPDAGEEWIELTFARPVHATGVRVVQNFNPGAIARIEVIDVSGAATPVWMGADPNAYGKNEIASLTAHFPRTTQPIAKVKVVVNEKKIPGWNEIDAVALIGPAP